MASDFTFRLLPALALLALAPASRADEVMADTPKPAAEKPGEKRPERKPRPPEEDREREQRESLEHVRRLLSMSDGQVTRMRAVLDAVEKIPADRRAELRKRIDTLRHATPDEREAFLKELREKYGVFEEPRAPKQSGNPGQTQGRDRVVRNLLEKHFATFAPEAADAERKRFLALPRDEKIEYIRKLREKYGVTEETSKDAKPPKDAKKPKAEPKTASLPAARPPSGDPFGA